MSKNIDWSQLDNFCLLFYLYNYVNVIYLAVAYSYLSLSELTLIFQIKYDDWSNLKRKKVVAGSNAVAR